MKIFDFFNLKLFCSTLQYAVEHCACFLNVTAASKTRKNKKTRKEKSGKKSKIYIKVAMKIAPTVPESKVIIVGTPGAGKTSIIQQFTEGKFNNDTESTVAASYVSMNIKSNEGNEITLNIWDTAGQERYRSLIPMYSRNASAAIIVIDLSSPDSFDAAEDWLRIVKDNCPANCKIYVVGNKKDLPPGFPFENLVEWATAKGFPLFETSALERESVVPVFKRIGEDMITSPPQVTTSSVVISKDGDKTKEDHAECC